MKIWHRQMVKELDAKWNLYRIRDWVLYVGRMNGKRDFRLTHFSNFERYIFSATAEGVNVEWMEK